MRRTVGARTRPRYGPIVRVWRDLGAAVISRRRFSHDLWDAKVTTVSGMGYAAVSPT
jgi:hypothetical protein